MSNFKEIMFRHLDKNNKGLTPKGQAHLEIIVDLIGSHTGLDTSLNLAKGLIENYFEDKKISDKIIKLIESNQK